jgi:hypothetical protein
MTKEIHSFNFSDIRKAIVESKVFLKDEYWEQDPMNCKTAIEYDLGITGDDGWELMEKFEKRFSVDMTRAKEFFYKYFDDESQFASPFIPIYVFLLIFLASLLIPVYFFDQKLAKDSFADLLTMTKGNRRESELLVGDLATSILLKTFTPRSTVLIQLKSN